MASHIYVKDLDSEVSFEQYYTELHTLNVLQLLKKYTLGLPRLILSSIKSKEEALVSTEDEFLRIS